MKVTKQMVKRFRDAIPSKHAPIRWTDQEIRRVLQHALAVQNETPVDAGMRVSEDEMEPVMDNDNPLPSGPGVGFSG